MDPFPPRTRKTHRQFHVPPVDWEFPKEWKWPWWKFGFKSGAALFNELHAEFNTVQCAIQDPFGWHLDVCDVADLANTRQEFLDLLQKRQDERYKELDDIWSSTKATMVGCPSTWERNPQTMNALWLRFVRISRNFSFDSIVGYFGAYTKDIPERKRKRALPNAGGSGNERQQQPQQGGEVNDEGAQPSMPDGEHKESCDNGEHRESRESPNSVSQRQAATEMRTEAKLPSQPAKSPNKVVKRRQRRGKTATPNEAGLRRSARLQHRAGSGIH
ncbi:hypothetical protein F4802DRAFT_555038 [Xylaria palmicola]|nr:hypothetical protein F4802DRAFT_555038 [Xylaria palmicola]